MDEETQRRVAFMLHKLGLLPRQNGQNQSPNNYPPFREFGSRRPSEPNMVRWAREQREQEALRKQFPSAFPRSASAPVSSPKPGPAPLTGTPRAVSKPMQDFLAGQERSTDWSKVRVRLGGNVPGSYASTNGNMASFSQPLRKDLKDFFHEMGHIPDWQDGTLTTPKYIVEAILSAGRYAAKASATYGMHASPTLSLPLRRPDAIWEDINYERAAIERAQRWKKAWDARRRSPSE